MQPPHTRHAPLRSPARPGPLHGDERTRDVQSRTEGSIALVAQRVGGAADAPSPPRHALDPAPLHALVRLADPCSGQPGGAFVSYNEDVRMAS